MPVVPYAPSSTRAGEDLGPGREREEGGQNAVAEQRHGKEKGGTDQHFEQAARKAPFKFCVSCGRMWHDGSVCLRFSNSLHTLSPCGGIQCADGWHSKTSLGHTAKGIVASSGMPLVGRWLERQLSSFGRLPRQRNCIHPPVAKSFGKTTLHDIALAGIG